LLKFMYPTRIELSMSVKAKYIVGLFAGFACLSGGCYMYRPGHGNLLDRGPEPVQKLVEAKLAEQRSEKTGRQRWEAFRSNTYQSQGDIVRDREQIGRERRREREAQKLIDAGPLCLADCLAFALEFNDQVQAKRSAIEAVGGDELIVRSRFLPEVFYNLEQEDKEKKALADRTHRRDQGFRLSQTVLEFGKDSAEDVVLRESQRTALFEYEDTAGEVLSDVRLKFFTVLLRAQQLKERYELLREFEAQYKRISKRYEKKQVVEVDVLTARLNMLNEEARINSLKKEILRQKIDLLHRVGFPVGVTGFELAGELEWLDLALAETVDLALTRSTAIAQARAVVAEQRRTARQVLWEYGPDMKLQAGWKDDRNAAGVELKGEDGFNELSAFAEQYVRPPRDGFLADQDVLAEDEEGWFLGLNLALPIFQGFERRGRYARETALLEEARHVLRDTIDRAELDVYKGYQTMLERREELRILAETVAISKKRLKAKERLNELDRISDDELETFRERFFRDQDAYFGQQIAHVAAQERLRFRMRYFEPMPTNKGKTDEASR